MPPALAQAYKPSTSHVRLSDRRVTVATCWYTILLSFDTLGCDLSNNVGLDNVSSMEYCASCTDSRLEYLAVLALHVSQSIYKTERIELTSVSFPVHDNVLVIFFFIFLFVVKDMSTLEPARGRRGSRQRPCLPFLYSAFRTFLAHPPPDMNLRCSHPSPFRQW